MGEYAQGVQVAEQRKAAEQRKGQQAEVPAQQAEVPAQMRKRNPRYQGPHSHQVAVPQLQPA